MPVNRTVVQQWLLILAATFAVVWAIVRACVQSVTIDEADTYVFFVYRSLSWAWYPSSNNHLLNTLLISMTTHLFGASSITVRAPALLGAILYVSICYFLCRSITDRFSLQLPLFICLTYNPFILDFMVAARGYSLATAFLLAAITIPVWHLSLRKSCILASLALALSFSANFSFAFVDLGAFLVIVTWAIRRRETASVVRVLGFCVLPGLLVTLLICGYTLANWRHGELWWGAHSLGEMTESLVQASLYRLDPRFRAAGWYRLMNLLGPGLLPALGLLCAGQLVVTRIDGTWLQNANARWLGRFAAALAGIAAFSVLLHWLAFRFYKLPLPLGRTGIYLVPLITLIAGIIAAAPARSLVSQWIRRGITAVFICLACYFLLCLRLTYFKEWQWDADVKDVYSVLARYNHAYGVKDVGITWWYVAPLNYYRVVSKEEIFPEFKAAIPEPTGRESIFVVNGLFDRKFLEQERLVTVYRGKSTDVTVAVRPGGPIPTTRVEP
jgi:hypothetical protein